MQQENIPAAKHPVLDCPWCWRVLYPGRAFPRGVSGIICAEHHAWQLDLIEEEAEAQTRRSTPDQQTKDEQNFMKSVKTSGILFLASRSSDRPK